MTSHFGIKLEELFGSDTDLLQIYRQNVAYGNSTQNAFLYVQELKSKRNLKTTVLQKSVSTLHYHPDYLKGFLLCQSNTPTNTNISLTL